MPGAHITRGFRYRLLRVVMVPGMPLLVVTIGLLLPEPAGKDWWWIFFRAFQGASCCCADGKDLDCS